MNTHRSKSKPWNNHWGRSRPALDDNADVWTEHVRRGWDTFREHLNNPAFLKLVGNLKGKTALDAGCGEGYNTRIFARMGAKMTASIFSPPDCTCAAGRKAGTAGHPVWNSIFLWPFHFQRWILWYGGFHHGADGQSRFLTRQSRRFTVYWRKTAISFSAVSHPCFMTRGFGWVTDRQSNQEKLSVSGTIVKPKGWSIGNFSGSGKK